MGLAACHYQSLGPTKTPPCDLVGLEPAHLLTPTFAGRIAPALSPLPVSRLEPPPWLSSSVHNPASRHLHLSTSISPHNPSPSLWTMQRAQIRSELRMKATCRVLAASTNVETAANIVPVPTPPWPPSSSTVPRAPSTVCPPWHIEQPTANIDPLPSPRDGHLYCQRRRQITPSRVQAFKRHRPPLEDLRSVDPLSAARRVPSPSAATPRRPSQHIVEIMRSSKGEDPYAVVPKQAVAQVHRNAETRRGPRAHRSPKESLRPLIPSPQACPDARRSRARKAQKKWRDTKYVIIEGRGRKIIAGARPKPESPTS